VTAGTRGTAEIAGGGIAGLGVGILLAQRGWRVRLHERNDGIREVGAGIYLRNNPLRVLEEIGVADEIQPHGVDLTRSLWRNGSGKILQDLPLRGERRLWMGPRRNVIQALERRAREVGVEIELDSRVVGATPDGALRFDDGHEVSADLVIGADGQLSRVRESLKLTQQRKVLDSSATRFIMPTREFAPDPWTTMYWSGRRRIGVTACGPDRTYVYLISSRHDPRGLQQPIEVPSWSNGFPALAPMLEALAGLPSIQHPYVLVRSSAWSVGRAAIIGDAAHGLPPLLGQGAGLALSNAWALAHTVDARGPAQVAAALREWEQQYRSYTEITQNWSLGLDVMARLWPRPLLRLRAPALVAIGRSSLLQNRMRVADGFPVAAA
jgi:2-polyprenyl-6-methoxyphenol hydroxylase-like FAD-dependent oxidoreductase